MKTKEEILAAAREIVANPPYVERMPAWLGDFLDGLQKFLENLFKGPVETIGKASPGTQLGIFIALILLLVVLLGHMGWTFYKFVRFPEGKGKDAANEGGEGLSDDPEEAARRAASQKDYAAALRHLFLGLLKRFGAEQPSRTRTPRECAVLLPLPDRFRPKIGAFVQAFEQVFFGRRPLSSEEFEKNRKLYREICRGEI